MARVEVGLLRHAEAKADVEVATDKASYLNVAAQELATYRLVHATEADARHAKLRDSDGGKNVLAGTYDEWLRAKQRARELEDDARMQPDIVLARAFRTMQDSLESLSRYERSLGRQALSALNALTILRHQRTTAGEAKQNPVPSAKQLPHGA